MQRKPVFIVDIILLILALSSCNLPNRQISPTPTPVVTSIPLLEPSPTPASLCDNQYFPSQLGDAWEYSGNNTAIGAYSRTDTITNSSAEAFSVSTILANVSYGVHYDCSAAGLTATDPIQQYVGALLSSPNSPVDVKLTSSSGVTLPASIIPGDTWQQTAGFEATSPDLNMNGRFVFNYAAVGFENVTIPLGTFNALRVDTTIRIEVSAFRVLAGTYTSTSWMVPEIGIIKSEGTSHVPNIDFSDTMQLTSFAPSP